MKAALEAAEEKLVQGSGIPDIPPDQPLESGTAGELGEVGAATARQIVEDDDPLAALQQPGNQPATDESGPAGYQTESHSARMLGSALGGQRQP